MKAYLYNLYSLKVVPTLYLFIMWATLSIGIGLFVGDLRRGMEIMSCFSLFYIVRGYYFRDLYGAINNAKSDEAQGQ